MIKALQAAGITGLILIGAWAAETLIDTVRPRTGLAWRLMVFLGIGLLIFGLSMQALKAQEHHPQTIHEKFYSTWMMPDAPATSCCHNQDCSPVPSRFANNRWEAKHNDFWVPIPPDKVEQKRDSPDGRSHLCGRSGPIGEFTVFCFIRGAGI